MSTSQELEAFLAAVHGPMGQAVLVVTGAGRRAA